VELSSSTCGSNVSINATSCSQTIPTQRQDLRFLFTPCTIGSMISISPSNGSAGTVINISGTGFSPVACENRVYIDGSSSSCQLINATSTSLLCQLAVNSSLIPNRMADVRVERVGQGFLTNRGQMQFRFEPSITSITPSQGKSVLATESIRISRRRKCLLF
jgi:hypothetical protein